ncbi:MAG: 3-hydroxyacyl-CoA dehydrogenase/enoyl-CoA hydratase family protein [Dehalococcoidia bacterium]|nr:3-hydroxyacyl-CoA dehydrogenase/enoyl-CoA hydratase family protein [Dehalococcoidia bacterium]
MSNKSKLYPTVFNPLLLKLERPLPREVAIVGAGTIGPDIGYFFKSAAPEIKLILVDVVEEPLKGAEKRLNGYVEKAIAKRKMKEEDGKKVLENITYTTDYSQIKNCDLVIEAATENIPLKQKIFAQIEAVVSDNSVITSNTSSIPADRLFLNLKRPQRATVTHFFAPAWRNPAVEVITWDKCDRGTVDYLFWMFCVLGKVPIISDNAICFILDRVFDNWCNEAVYLLDQATASQVDTVGQEFAVSGPLWTLNMARGNPIVFECNSLQMEEGACYKPSLLLQSVDMWKTVGLREKAEVPDDMEKTIKDRLLGILFSQSFDIVNRSIGTSEDLNLGCQVALGFNRGPLDVMKDIGEAETGRIIKKFQQDRKGFPGMEKSFEEYQDFNRHVLVDNVDGVEIITIRRPQFMNALSDEVNDEILAVLKQGVKNPEVEGFVITGYGPRAFCAGAEIGRFTELMGDAKSSAQYARDCAKVQMFIDQMDKPVVAAVNGMALGGGFEMVLRCHRVVATGNATFQFPEITLGILPGIGGCVVPYRKWPASAGIFHEMLCLGKAVGAKEAADIGLVNQLADSYLDMVQKAIKEVKGLSGKIQRIPDGRVDIPEIKLPDQPVAGKLALSKEAIAVMSRTIKDAAAAESFNGALEIGYTGFGEIACTDAAKEGIAAFMSKRQPEYKK